VLEGTPVGLHASLSLTGVPLPAPGADWRPYLVYTGVQVVAAAVLVGTGSLRAPRDQRPSADE
jgi:hypothetical protein